MAGTALTPGSYLSLLGNSLLIAGGATLVALCLAVPLSLAIFKLRIPGYRVFRAIVIGAAVLPTYIYAAAWLGALQHPLFSTGLISGASSSLLMIQGVFVSGLAKVLLATLLMGIALWGIPPEAEEAAWLHTRRRGVLFHVVNRHIIQGTIFAGSIIFGLTLSEISVTDMLSIRTLAEESYIQFQLTLDPGIAAITGIGAFLPILLPWGFLLAYRSRQHFLVEEPTYSRHSVVFRDIPRVYGGIICLAVILVLLLILGIPLLALVSKSGFITSWPAKLKAIGNEFIYSTGIAMIASFIAVVTAFPITYLSRGRKSAAVLVALALAALFIPGAVLGIGLVRLFNHPGISGYIYNSPIILFIGQALRFFPLAMLIQWVFLKAIPRIYDDMVVVDGLSVRQAITHIHFPICIRPLSGCWLIGFLWCIGELDTSIIVCPPGLTTLPVRIFTMMHYGIYGEVAVACLVLGGLIFLSIMIVMLVLVLKNDRILTKIGELRLFWL